MCWTPHETIFAGEILKRFFAKPLVRNVIAVGSGTALAQVVALAFYPLITRIYTPEAFGLQGIFLALVGILSPVIALRLPMAIIVADSDERARQIARLSHLIAAGMAVLFWVTLLVAGPVVLKLLGAQALGGLIYLLPLALVCVAFETTAMFQASRQGAFRVVGVVATLHAVVVNLARVLGGLLAPAAGVLVAVTTIAPAIKAGMLSYGTRDQRPPAAGVTLAEARSIMAAHRDFPFYRMPTDVLNAISQTSPVLLLSALFSPAAAGLFVLARSVIYIPLSILGTALGNVFYARFAELERQKKPLFPLAAKATLIQLLGPGLGFGLCALFFPTLFAIVFGEEWRISGVYAQWMTIWLICMLMNIPAVRAMPVIKRQGLHFVFNLFVLVGAVVGLFGGYYFDGTELGTIKYFSLAMSFIYLCQIAIYLAYIKHHDDVVARADFA